MKKNILIIGLAGMIGMSSGFISCSPDYETEFKVEKLVVPDKSQAPIIFPLTGGESTIIVETNVPFGNWQAESNAEWCKITPQKDKVVVTASENNIYKQRQAEITISYGHQSYSITVMQFGLEPVILIDGKKDDFIKVIDAETEEITIPVATNLDLDNILIPDTCNWIRLAEKPTTFDTKSRATKEVNKQELKFILDKSTETELRYCTVILQSSQNYNHTASFLIKQQPRGYIVEIDEDKKVHQVKAMGGTITVPFKVNSPAGEVSYTYEIEESAQSWIVPVSVPASRALRDVSESFTIKANTEVENVPREGKITFKSKKSTDKVPSQFVVTVKQDGFIATPPLNVINAIATPEAGRIKLQWDIPEEVDFNKIKITYYDKVTKEDKETVIDDYHTTSCIIDDTYQCAGEYSFTIMTYGPTGMATEKPVIVKGTSGEATDKERVELTVDMLSANATQPGDGDGLPALIDGKVNTYYHSRWQAPATTEPHYIQIKLKNPLKELRFEYDARQNGVNNGGDVKSAIIYGSMNGEYFESMGSEEFNLPTTNGGHATAKNNVSGKQAYNYIRFTPTARRNLDPLDYTNNDKAWWNMSEIYLYRIRHDEAWAKEQLGI